MHNLRQYEVPLHRYRALMDLQVISDFLVSHSYYKKWNYTWLVLILIKSIILYHDYELTGEEWKAILQAFDW